MPALVALIAERLHSDRYKVAVVYVFLWLVMGGIMGVLRAITYA